MTVGAAVTELDDVGCEELHEAFDVAARGREELLDHAPLVLDVGCVGAVVELLARAARQLSARVGRPTAPATSSNP